MATIGYDRITKGGTICALALKGKLSLNGHNTIADTLEQGKTFADMRIGR